MKTTIDIPEPLYKRANIHAVQTSRTLKHLILVSLSRQLDTPVPDPHEQRTSIWERRRLLPEFERARKRGAFRPAAGARDVTALIFEDRDAR